MSDLIIGPDGLARPVWASASPLLRHYYDTEWGIPVTDEVGLFERLSLEAFQSGLSWATILTKRDSFRRAFFDFKPEAVSTFDQPKVEELMQDASIVRNRRKIEATIANARATIELRPDGGLAELIWSFKPQQTPRPLSLQEIPTKSPESAALSKELKRRGFAFVGPTTMYALMEAIGMVDTHLVGSHRRGSAGIWVD